MTWVSVLGARAGGVGGIALAEAQEAALAEGGRDGGDANHEHDGGEQDITSGSASHTDLLNSLSGGCDTPAALRCARGRKDLLSGCTLAVVRHDDLATMHCAIARTMAILGERWTFVILRSAFTGARRFEDYQQGTKIARNILTDRLKTLVEHGILERRPYAEHPGRTLYEYRLTDKGLDLYPVLVSLMQWGNQYGGFEDGPPVELHPQALRPRDRAEARCSECGEELRAREVRATTLAPETV